MTRRAIFKAVLNFGDVTAPVKLYSAVREERVRFRLLHKDDKEPLSGRMFCSAEDEPVEVEERVRGFEVARGQYVVLTREEMKAVRPETGRRIEVRHFVERDGIDPRMYDRPYYLGPDKKDSAYALVHRALKESERVGLCTWTMRQRSYYGALEALDELLLLVTLRYHHEIVPVEELGLAKREVKEKELESAKALIDDMHDDFDPSDYQNDYQQNLMYFIERKAKGEEPRLKRPPQKKPTRPSDLQKTLERSLEQRSA